MADGGFDWPAEMLRSLLSLLHRGPYLETYLFDRAKENVADSYFGIGQSPDCRDLPDCKLLKLRGLWSLICKGRLPDIDVGIQAYAIAASNSLCVGWSDKGVVAYVAADRFCDVSGAGGTCRWVCEAAEQSAGGSRI